MKNIVKKIVVFLLAGSVFVWTMYIESGALTVARTAMNMNVVVSAGEKGANLLSGGDFKVVSGEMDVKVEDKVQTEDGQSASIGFDDGGVIRLAPLSSLVLKDVSESGYVFELEKGRAWVNDHFASIPVRVLAGGAFLEPRRASFDVSFDGEQTQIGAFSSQVTVNLVLGGDPNPINSFLVAEGGQATVSLAKVKGSADLLKRLLYSKLVKEFNYSLMDMSASGQDPWISGNLADDADLLAAVSTKRMATINARGLKYSSLDSPGYQIDKAVIGLSDNLTFTEEKRVDLLIDSINEQFLDAEYLLVFGRSTESMERIALYEKLMNDGFASGGELFRKRVLEKMRGQYNQLFFVLPTDPLFDVKIVLSDFLLSELEKSPQFALEKLGLIRDYMNYAYTLAQTDQLKARISLQNYFVRFKDFIENEKSQLAGIKSLFSDENRIMDNLLKQYPQFYQDTFFAMKSFIETEWLKLLPEGNDKNEERQTIISTKIDFLKQLQSFFLSEKIALADAKQVLERLMSEIQALQTGTDIGVSGLFALRLRDYGNFQQFLKTTNVSQLRGSSPQKEYEKYLKLQSEQLEIDKLKETPVIPQPEPESVPVPVPVQPEVSQSDRVAKILLIQKLKANGIMAVESNISVVSALNGEFAVDGVTLVSNKDIRVSFNFNSKTSVVSGLIVKAPAGDLKVLNEYPLAQLDAAATQVYNKADTL